MGYKLTITFTPPSPDPGSYRVTYWPTVSPSTTTTIFVTGSPVVLYDLPYNSYAGTVESFCGSQYSTVENFSSTVVCNLNAVVVGQNPTNLAGDNGTAQVTSVTGGSGSYSYLWSNGQTGSIATGLSENTSYSVLVTDLVNNCQTTAQVTLGQTNFTFDADYMVITYQFTDGQDLDTRTRIVAIDGVIYQEQNQAAKYMGWGQLLRVPQTAAYPPAGASFCDASPRPLAAWGLDNTGTGFESVCIDLTQLSAGQQEIVVDCRCFWFNIPGSNPVTISVTLWKGGCPITQGALGNPAYGFANPTATASLVIGSANKVITARNLSNLAVNSSDLESPAVAPNVTRGQRLAVITYNKLNNTGTIDINDTSTLAP